MGLFSLVKHALFWPVTGPQYLIEFSLERVQGVVREELTDDSRIKAELMELQLQLELGEIDDAEYAAREAELMQRLREVREWREHFGMGVSGGPVRVRAEDETDYTERAAAEEAEARRARAEAGAEAAEDEPRGPASPHGAEIDVRFDFDDERP